MISVDLDAISARSQPCPRCELEVPTAPCICRDDPRLDVLALISYARSLESQLAERDEQIVRLKEDVEILQTHICDLLHPDQPCHGWDQDGMTDPDRPDRLVPVETCTSEIVSLRSQLAESQRENEALREQLRQEREYSSDLLLDLADVSRERRP